MLKIFVTLGLKVLILLGLKEVFETDSHDRNHKIAIFYE